MSKIQEAKDALDCLCTWSNGAGVLSVHVDRMKRDILAVIEDQEGTSPSLGDVGAWCFDMETAPKDGTAVLIWCRYAYGWEHVYTIGRWTGKGWWAGTTSKNDLTFCVVNPIAWQPLSSPPSTHKGEGEL